MFPAYPISEALFWSGVMCLLLFCLTARRWHNVKRCKSLLQIGDEWTLLSLKEENWALLSIRLAGTGIGLIITALLFIGI